MEGKDKTRHTATLVIWMVGIYAHISLIGALSLFFFLASKARAIPTEQVPLLMALSASGGSAIVGLLGLLGRTSGEAAMPSSVQIHQPANDPIPVAQTPPPDPAPDIPAH